MTKIAILIHIQVLERLDFFRVTHIDICEKVIWNWMVSSLRVSLFVLHILIFCSSSYASTLRSSSLWILQVYLFYFPLFYQSKISLKIKFTWFSLTLSSSLARKEHANVFECISETVEWMLECGENCLTLMHDFPFLIFLMDAAAHNVPLFLH
jgi:hypothetical protein